MGWGSFRSFSVRPFAASEEVVESTAVVDYGHTLTHVPDAWKHTKGDRVSVGVIDTGYPDHQNLDGAVAGRWPWTAAPDSEGHGTFCAGIIGAREVGQGIVGVAPKCRLFCARAVPGSWWTVGQALQWCVSCGCDVINMSFGSTTPPPSRVAEAFRRAHNSGIFMCAAAGNNRIDGKDTVTYPARLPWVVPVAAIGPGASDAPFSATGSELERGFAMPGVSVLSTWTQNRFVRTSGTSFASPFVAGMAALAISKEYADWDGTKGEYPRRERAKVLLSLLESHAVSVGDPSKFGHGYIDGSKL